MSDAWHFLQSELWARHKESFGWTAVTVAGEADGSPLLTLTRRLPLGVLLTYVPYGPADRAANGTVAGNRAFGPEGTIARPGVPGPVPERLGRRLAALVPRIREAVRQRTGRDPALVRFDLPQAGAPEALVAGYRGAVDGHGSPLRTAPVEVQPPSTVLVDLSGEPDALLQAMHKKNRYNIRLAERKGVTVREAEVDELGSWYELYRETARRDRITIHSLNYYRRLFELAAELWPAGAPDAGGPQLKLYLAEHAGDLLAGIVVVHYARGATYLYGASSDRKRNLMPNYALQWHAMTSARDAGCSWYDLFGVPPADDESHPMHGLYRFKTGFGGHLVARLGAWDALVGPLSGTLFRLAERVRDVYFHRVR